MYVREAPFQISVIFVVHETLLHISKAYICITNGSSTFILATNTICQVLTVVYKKQNQFQVTQVVLVMTFFLLAFVPNV